MTELKATINRLLASSKLSPSEKLHQILGRKGILKAAYDELPGLKQAERIERGRLLNRLKHKVQQQLEDNDLSTADPGFDLSLPPLDLPIGTMHPINQTMDRMVDIFMRLGFEIFTGPEIVSDENNFGLLNFPADHPARDTQDSFSLVNSKLMLRTQTSAVQIPIMKNHDLPMRIIVPGKAFRREVNATHMPMFHQLEGFIVDEQVRFTDLKGVLSEFMKQFFGQELKMRFRTHYFPFTEPSAEVDIWWQRESGTGRWLEVLGCGMIHPQVLENAGINSKKFQGIAFGLGLERPFMLRHKVDDMRLLYDNDESFLKSFFQL
ncbi:MAG: phenylalanine--tRNA ligase subunit alpha [bacterium]|nr:phenylalanine--tRNA ligase subunit alpha [bacterium]